MAVRIPLPQCERLHSRLRSPAFLARAPTLLSGCIHEAGRLQNQSWEALDLWVRSYPGTTLPHKALLRPTGGRPQEPPRQRQKLGELVVMHPMASALERDDLRVLEVLRAAILGGI